MRESIQDEKYSIQNGDRNSKSSVNSKFLVGVATDDIPKIKVPQFKQFKSGKGGYIRRLLLIDEAVRILFAEYLEELRKCTPDLPAYPTASQLDEVVAEKFETQFGKNDGWDFLIDEDIAKLSEFGQDWDDPVEREAAVKRIYTTLFGAQISEGGFAGSTAFLAIKDDFKKLIQSPKLFFGTALLLFVQSVLSTYINWNGVDRHKGSKGKIAPVIRIGNKVILDTEIVDGKTVRIDTKMVDYEPSIHDSIIDKTFDIDPKFRPLKRVSENNGNTVLVANEKYNPTAVEFFIHGIKYFHQHQKDYSEWKKLTSIAKINNAMSFSWTNIFAATINSYVCLVMFNLFIPSPMVNLALTIPFAGGAIYFGRGYYVEFTEKNVLSSSKAMWSSDNPIYLTGKINKWQRIEVQTQWFLNAVSRAIGIGLGVSALLDLVVLFIEGTLKCCGLDPTIINNISNVLTFLDYAIAGTSVVMGFLNTRFSRMIGAEGYLTPFKINGPFTLDRFIAPYEELLFKFLKSQGVSVSQTKLNRPEMVKCVAWAIFYGLTFGIPAWMGCSGANTFEYWHLLPSISVLAFKSFATSRSEIPHNTHVKARKAIEDLIDSHNKQEIKVTVKSPNGYELPDDIYEQLRPIIEAIKHKLSQLKKGGEVIIDSHGNELLKEDECGLINDLLNLLEQLFRIMSRSGALTGFMMKYGLPHFINWFNGVEGLSIFKTNAVFWNLLLLTPAINEFGTYSTTTAPIVNPGITKKINQVRELAGTPTNEIKGSGCSYFVARQLVCFLPFIFTKKPVRGISEKTWSEWFCGRQSNQNRDFKHPAPTQASVNTQNIPQPKNPRKERGCWDCISRLFSRNHARGYRRLSDNNSQFEVNSRSDSVYGNNSRV